MTSLSVMGVGRVGGEVAFLAAATGLVDKLTLLDMYTPLLEAQVLDLRHTGLDITITSDPETIRDTDIFVFAAGTPRNPNIRTRADLLGANLPVADMCGRYLEGFGGVVISVTNPMDANTCYLQQKSGLDRSRVIGFGGQLDSARFRGFLADRGYDTDEAWVLGEHGEHQVPLFSRLPFTVPAAEQDEILSEMRAASMPVIRGKGGTVFGPAFGIVRLIQAIIDNERVVLPVCCVLEGEYGERGVAMGVPAEIGSRGIESIIEWDLSARETDQLHTAAENVRALCRKAGL
ncbi:MAG: lactate dehydrogenase [Methanomicrobiaceae archaeon]|nr:lactate dehydrogenase [Methanomicrobiaceae archaeon]